MVELIQIISWDEYEPGTFEVYTKLRDSEQHLKDSVLKLDYDYTPWPRFNGNLLWL